MENPNSKSDADDGLSRRRGIEDLPDKELSEILIRLPCYKTVITCKFVSKRWLSLLSNPKFVIDFVNHKRKKKQNLLPWTFLSLRQVKLIKDDDYKTEQEQEHESFIDTHNEVFYRSPKFSLNFLPLESGSFKSIATFKDLILCIDVNYKDHYICNPVTKRWVVLPPIPVSLTPRRVVLPHIPLSLTQRSFWSCLICEDPFNKNNNNNIDDYKFRVVVIPFPSNYKQRQYGDKYPFVTLKVFVFCSELWEWIDVDVRLPLHTLGTPCVGAHPRKSACAVKGVVCKGMVCFCYDVYFGMFDPFKITARARGSTSTIDARFLPIPFSFQETKLVEWDGKLVSYIVTPLAPVYHRDKEGNLLVDHKAGDRVEISLQVLNLNQVIDIDNDNNNEVEVCWTKRLLNTRICIDKSGRPQSLCYRIHSSNFHPTKSRFLYILTEANEVLLCDTRSNTLNTLGRFEESNHLLSYSNIRLELQHWPTPLPTIPQASS